MLKTDEYVSFEKTNHKNPYDCPLLLELEDTFGYMTTYKRPFNKGDMGYLIRKKKRLHQNKCRDCYRLPENHQLQPEDVQKDVSRQVYHEEASKRSGSYDVILWSKIPLNCQGCRVLRLKQEVNKEINIARRILKLKEKGLLSPAIRQVCRM